MANEVKLIVTGKNNSRAALQQPLSDLQKIRAAADKIPDKKEIRVVVKGGAEEVDQLNKKKLDDKEIKVTADTGKAESDIRGLANEGKPVEVPVTADTGKAKAEIGSLKAEKVTVPVESDTSKARDALEGLQDLGVGVGDKFSGGMMGALAGGVAGATATIGMTIVDGIADEITESNRIERALNLKFTNAGAEVEKFTSLFDTGWLEGLADTLGGGSLDKGIRALNEAGIETEQLAEGALIARTAFSEFSQMAADDQRALVAELGKAAVMSGTDIPTALKGASAAAKTWGISGWDATRLVIKGFDEMDSRGDDWAETLNEYSPFFKRLGMDGTQALKSVSTMLEHGTRNTDIAADAFKEFSLRVIDGSVGSRGALYDLGIDADKAMAAIAKGGKPAAEATDAVIDKLNQVQDPVERNRIGVALMGTQWEDTARDVLAFVDVLPGTTTALNASGIQAKFASEKAAGLKEAFDQLKGPFESAATTADLVSNALDRMNQKTPTLRDTTQAWNDLVRDFAAKVDWDDAAKGVQGLSGSLVGLKGEVDTTTAAGSKLEDWAQSSKEAFVAQAGALREAGVPASEMTTKLNVMRDAFIANAVAQGLPKEAAIRLANAYGMVPGEVSTAIYAPGLLQRMTELGMLGNQIRTLPDGRFTVTGNTDPARNSITQLVTDYQGRVITLRVVTSGASAGLTTNVSGRGRQFLASGGVVVGHAAEGGPRDGLTMVNERGPELRRTQRGALIDAVGGETIVPAGQSAMIAAAASGGQGGGFGGPIVVQVMLDKRQVGLAVVDDIRRQVGSKAGGSVSKFFGGKP